jgi:molybdopterin-binding protein
VIETSGLSARVGRFVLRDVSITVPAGAYATVIGPAGAGKTTLLETIAGVVRPTGGALRLLGASMLGVAPERRPVGLVYQHAYLFPHLSVAGNVAYGADADSAREAAELVGAASLFDRRVDTLSGGERQVVALARALARRPRVLLLDEPFGALDPRRRTAVRNAVRRAHREWGLTTLHVTHDFAEAELLGDMTVVLDGGRVLQQGTPEAVFRRPASAYVAEFLGAENLYAGEVRTPDADVVGASRESREVTFASGALLLHAVTAVPDGPAHAVIRGEEITLSGAPAASSARNVVAALVTEVAPAGPLTRVTLDVAGTPLVALVTTHSAESMALRAGTTVHASLKATAVHLI